MDDGTVMCPPLSGMDVGVPKLHLVGVAGPWLHLFDGTFKL